MADPRPGETAEQAREREQRERELQQRGAVSAQSGDAPEVSEQCLFDVPDQLVTPPSGAPWPAGYEPPEVLEENRKAEDERRKAEDERSPRGSPTARATAQGKRAAPRSATARPGAASHNTRTRSMNALQRALQPLARLITPRQKAAEGEYRPGPWLTTEGWLPHSWGQYANFWQMGYDPITGGTSSIVEACVWAYVRAIAQLPGYHRRELDNGGTETITTSALSRLLRVPNGYQTPSDFLVHLIRSLLLNGNQLLDCAAQ